MSASNSNGIQALLDAEKQAAGVVQEAREYRTTTLREARELAKKEIAAYKEEAEKKFQAFAGQHTSGSKEAEAASDKLVADSVAKYKADFAKNKDAVAKELFGAIILEA